MEDALANFESVSVSSKHVVQRLLTIGENRLELLAVEVQEERERLLHALLMALGVAAFGLLATMTFTAAIVVLLWAASPAVVLLTLTVLGMAAAPCGSASGSLDSCATGRRSPPRSINFERTAHAWKNSSRKPACFAEATVDCRKRAQSRQALGGSRRNDGRGSHSS